MVKLAMGLVGDGMFGLDIRVPSSPGGVSLPFLARFHITLQRRKIEKCEPAPLLDWLLS